uniref:Uncharacterized protein n=1 Tax=Prevotella sp. GTC17253 TaxID=3236793 RepID=A0AB33IN19_9BACT
MDENQATKQGKKRKAYVRPEVEVISVKADNHLMETSFPNSGGHNKVEDDGNDLNAKRGFFFDDEAGEDFNMWED